jgi:hypothetical protein
MEESHNFLLDKLILSGIDASRRKELGTFLIDSVQRKEAEKLLKNVSDGMLLIEVTVPFNRCKEILDENELTVC